MDKLWLKHYPQGVPSKIDCNRYASLNELFSESFKRFGPLICYSNMGTDLSFQELEKRSRQFAVYLQQLNLPKGARVAVMMPNLLQYPIAILGILRAGLVVVNTNPLYTADEITHQLNDAKVDVIVIWSQRLPILAQSLTRIPSLRYIIRTDIGDGFPWIKRCLVNLITTFKQPTQKTAQIHTISFLEALAQGDQHQLLPVACNHDDMAFLQYTGGTTGLSKGAMLTHGNIIANILQASAWISPQKLGPGDNILTALPLYHIFSLTANCLLFFHLGAQNVLITDPRNIKALLKQIHTLPPTAMTGVNTLFSALLNHSKFQATDFAHLKIALSGGMALHETIAARWQQLVGHPIIEAYGLTEASPAVSINPSDQPHRGSIGLPLPSTEVSIRNEQGEECPIGETGELCIRGPQIMKGYWQNPQETASVFYPDGFLRTGDSARVDEDGFIYLIDRLKDLIIVSGFNVYPNEVEQVIAQMDKVLEVGVIGVTSKSGNERIKACVVARDASLTSEDVIAHCRQHLTAYKIPKIVEFYAELPKTNVGKVLRRMLR
ncbi:MAG: long-chain-fatty-acid--CoA ligase [Legionella sp.]|nr:MAG: long-chain-fatty-acid--CoA ligase [Legionella sp.]